MTYRVCVVCTATSAVPRWPSPSSVRAWRRPGLDSQVEVDSAGTGGWHEGDGTDPRTVSVLEANGYESEPAARQFHDSWFARLDLVISLDSGHLRALRRLAPTPENAAEVRLLHPYDPTAGDDLDIPDPYYGGMDGFEECLEMVEAASPGLLAVVREHLERRAA